MTHGLGDVLTAFTTPAAVRSPTQSSPAPRAEHACVDFRYLAGSASRLVVRSPPERVQSPTIPRIFARQHNPRHFYDPAAQSVLQVPGPALRRGHGLTPSRLRRASVAWGPYRRGEVHKPRPGGGVRAGAAPHDVGRVQPATRTQLRFIRDLRRYSLTDRRKRAQRTGIAPLSAPERDGAFGLRERRSTRGVTYDVADRS